MSNYEYEPLPISSPLSSASHQRRSRHASRLQSSAVRLLMTATPFLLILYAYLELRLRSSSTHTPTGNLTHSDVELKCHLSMTTVFAPAVTSIDKLPKEEEPASPPSDRNGPGTTTTFKTSDYVVGAPTKSFKDNLRSDKKYLLSFLDAGWTNDIMTIANSIYLAMITSRIPIIPPFPPNGDHMSWEDQHLAFSDVFDFAQFQEDVGIPMIEWKDLKEGVEEEQLGCWSPWMTATVLPGHNPRGSKLYELFGLDVSFTATPESTKLGPADSLHSALWPLAELAYPQGRQRALSLHPEIRPTRTGRMILEPDEHVVCYDYLYYTGVSDIKEWERDYSPVWRFVGTHLRFRENIINMAKAYIRRAIGVADDHDIPPFIAMHVRHSDFARMCGDVPLERCYRPVSAWAKDVVEVRRQLAEKKGIDVSTVIVTSDETNPDWWNEIKEQGWHFANHLEEGAENPYGVWLPIIIDACVQSLGIGLVGTSGSTMSLVSQRRVEEWNGGVGMMSKWAGWGMEPDY